jgi:hypothetical protein
MRYEGGCHCGAVKFEIEAPEELEVSDCNCSICSMSGFLHLILSKSKFKLLSGENELITYSFNTGVAKHRFCKICGVKSFYIPRSNPDGVDVNIRCLFTKPKKINIKAFDGQNWEQNVHKIAHLK